MPLIVRNAKNNAVVFSEGDITLTWTAAGDQSGNDTQWAPDAIANYPSFLESVARGVLVVEEADDDLLAKIHKFTQRRPGVRRLSEQGDGLAGLNAVIDRSQDKDITTGVCIEPGCGTPILTTVKMIEDKPPLCDRHEVLAPYYSISESGSRGEGNLTKTWAKLPIAARS